ncbi:MAG: glycosyltransferase [Candidatus Thiodiazotropha taylori]|nr:glycosyltransferase [Candidatus Thiodiazotropha taylori]
MNVCHVISGDLWGGAESQAFKLIIESKLNGIDTCVVVFNKTKLYEMLKRSNVDVFSIDEASNTILSSILKLRRILKQKHIDIIHAHGIKEHLIGGIAAKLVGGCKVVRTHHGLGRLNANRLLRSLELLNSKLFSDALIAVSKDLEQQLIGKGHPKSKISVIHNGIDCRSVTPARSIQEVRDALDIDEHARVVGTLGRMVPVKGHKYLLQAQQWLLSSGVDCVVVIAGDGPLMEETKQLAAELDIEAQVRFLGHVDEAYDILSAFDIFVLTSLHEGVPISILEASCLGVPLVATAVGGVTEVIEDGVNGLLIAAKSPTECADACARIFGDSSVKTGLSENARRKVGDEFSSERCFTTTKKLYSELL